MNCQEYINSMRVRPVAFSLKACLLSLAGICKFGGRASTQICILATMKMNLFLNDVAPHGWSNDEINKKCMHLIRHKL